MTFAINSAKKKCSLTDLHKNVHHCKHCILRPLQNASKCNASLNFHFKKKTLKRLKIRVYTKLLTCM